MVDVPKNLTIDLEDNDLRKGLDSILESMSRIRNESITKSNIKDEQKDEYLHLAYRLASIMQETSDQATVKRVQEIVEDINNNPLLISYDPLQSPFWNRKNARFVDNLETILISIVGEDFNTIDDSHHILQAIKYLGSQNETPEERKRIYDTISPFNSAIPIREDEKLTKGILGKLFGASYDLKSIDGMILKAEGSHVFSPELIEFAQERGYGKLRINLNEREFEEMKKKNIAFAKLGINSDERKLTKIGNKLIKYTKYVSYPILGALSRKMQGMIAERFDEYDQDTAFMYSNILQGAVSTVSSITTAVFMKSFWPLSGLLLSVDSVIRGIATGDGTDNYKGPRGSLPFVLAFLPLEKYLGKRMSEKYEIEIPLKKNNIGPVARARNILNDYDNIARLAVPEVVDKNLIWSTENHHSFGARLVGYLEERFQMLEKIQKTIDQPSQMVIYNDRVQIDKYSKSNTLYCAAGNIRYVLTSIVEDDKEDFTRRAASILSSGKDMKSIMKDMEGYKGMKFAHLRKYENSDLVLEASI